MRVRRSRLSGGAFRVSAAVLAGVLVAPLAAVFTAPAAAAVDAPSPARTVSCLPSTPVFARLQNGELRRYTHDDGVGGGGVWGPSGTIGTGWSGTTIAGPDGLVYNITPGGEFRKLRWNGTDWDRTNGAQYEVIATGWGGWDLAPYRDRIVFDSRGDLYRVQDDNKLRWSRFDSVTKQWQDRVIDADFGRFNLIVAAGDGVLYARDPNQSGGALYRFQYDVAGDRFTQRDVLAGTGWNIHSGIFSPGADILYGHTAGVGEHGQPGELYWYRMDQNAKAIATRTYNGWGWGYGREWDVTAQTNACTLAPATLSTVRCASSTPVYARLPDATLRLYTHNDSATGNPDWAPMREIGTGWTGSVLPGLDGVVYNITPSGDVRRLRWNGTAWDLFAGSQWEKIDSGWFGWDTPSYQNRITVDSRGDFYSVQDDFTLRWKRYDAVAKKWDVRLIDGDWGRFDLIAAAGEGVIYARDPSLDNGRLYRFQYDAASQRWLQREKFVSSGWNRYSGVFSPGADILYSRTSGTGDTGNPGELTWFRADQAGRSVAGRVANGWGWGYGREWDVVAPPNTCTLATSSTPERPAVPAVPNAPTALVQSADGGIQHFWVNAAGALVHGEQRDVQDIRTVNFRVMPGYQQLTDRPSAVELADGRLQVVAQGRDSEVRSNRTVTKGGAWFGLGQAGGFLASAPTVVRGAGDELVSFGVDGAGALWFRSQDGRDGDLAGWLPLGGGDLSATAPSVVRVGDTLRIVALGRDGVHRTATLTNGSLSAWSSLGGADWVGAASVVTLADGKLQVFARRADNVVHTQVEGDAGFTGTWTALPGVVVAAGAPAALLTPAGNVEVTVRDASGLVYNTGTVTPGGSSYRAWQAVGTDEAVTDPAVLGLLDGTWVITFRDRRGVAYLYQDVSSEQVVAKRSAEAATQPRFTRVELPNP